MKRFRITAGFALMGFGGAWAPALHAFNWPGGPMTIAITCYGQEEFAGYAPTSPWGASNWTIDPALELRDGAGNVVAQYTLTGGAADWFDGGSRSGTAHFNPPAGNYTLVGRRGTKHQLIAGDGWSGYSLNFGSIADPVPPNTAPSIAWSSAPGTVASGQTYTMAAHGHDADGNLSQVNIWKNGQPFAFAGGGNGTDGDSSNPTSDSGPASITFMAQAVDAQGVSSPVISQTVTVSAPPMNRAPTIAWTSAPGNVPSGQSYTISAHGHDPDGNLTQVNIWRNGAPYAFAGGGNGTDNDSGNPSTDPGPGTINYTANAVDAQGLASGTISQTVTIAAPPGVTAAIAANPASTTAPATFTINWSTSNATSVAVTGNGIASSSANGSQTISGLPDGSYDYTITAQGYGGPITKTVSVTVAARPAVTASISANPNSCTAPGTCAVSWESTNATAVSVSGPGLSSAASSGSQTVSGLSAGSYTYAITAQGANGPASQQVTVVVAPAGTADASISASPSNSTAPGTTTINWSTTNAASVAVSGPGVSSTAPNGSQTVTGLAAGTYSYAVTVQGNGGPLTRATTVTVAAAGAPPPVTAAISASPGNATAPGSTTVSWNTSNATGVTVSGTGLSSTAANGSQTISGLATGTYSYTITAQGGGGPLTRTATVIVGSAANVAASISTNPTSATEPGAVTVTWTSSDASAVTVTGPGLDSTAPSGTQTVSGLAAGTYTYTLTAQGNSGPVTRTASLTVNSAAAVTGVITVSPASMTPDGTATVSWSTGNASAVTVNGYALPQSPEHVPSMTVRIGGLQPGDTTWTLWADGVGGPITRTATIHVTSPDGLYASLTVSPTVIYSNDNATLNWTTSGTDFRWVHGYLPGMNGVSVYPIPANGSTVVRGLAPGSYRFVLEYGPGSTTTRLAFADLMVLGVNRTVTVAVTPVGAGAVNGGGTYTEGDSATLTPVPDATHVFSGWTGDFSGAVNPLNFTVGPRDYAVTANFAPKVSAVAVKYRAESRTQLQNEQTTANSPLITERP